MSSHRGGLGNGGGYDPIKGERDVRELGGFTDRDCRLLDSQPSDSVRRRMVKAWFGAHGGRWAWEQWCHSRWRSP